MLFKLKTRPLDFECAILFLNQKKSISRFVDKALYQQMFIIS